MTKLVIKSNYNKLVDNNVILQFLVYNFWFIIFFIIFIVIDSDGNHF